MSTSALSTATQPDTHHPVSTNTPHALFTPLKIGNIQLQHRIVMAPMTRYRADDDHVPTDMMLTYYAQRASTPGTLIITEGTIISPRAGGCDNAPGIWNKEQVEAWRKIVDAIHTHGSFVFLQLWALGRYADPSILEKEAKKAGLPATHFPYVSASDIPPPKSWDGETTSDVRPRPLTEEEIDEYVVEYVQAARNAVEAGFDGVEVNCANGYLLDQFLQDVSNTRKDTYGGPSITNRATFPLLVLSSIVSHIGANRTAIRLSPWNVYQGMRMSDPVPTFEYVTREIRRRVPALAYLHFVEGKREGDSNEFARRIWREGRVGAGVGGGEDEEGKGEGAVFLSASGHTRESAFKNAERGDVVVFGKWFISNPDLPRRIKEDIPFTAFDYDTFYTKMSPKGYADYAFALSS